MAEARRLSQAVVERRGFVRESNKRANPGTGIQWMPEPSVSVSDELARFGAYPSMGGYPATEYSNSKRPTKKPAKRKTQAKRKK